jgi:hypothetical protein
MSSDEEGEGDGDERADGDGDEEEDEAFEPHPIAALVVSALQDIGCGDFATFGIAALPFPGLCIHSLSGVSSGASARIATGAALVRPNGAFQVSLPLTLEPAVDQLKARCTLAADGASNVWEISAAHCSIENPAFSIAVSASGPCGLLVVPLSSSCGVE